MSDAEYVNPALTKKQMREEKKRLKQSGNQQKRAHEKAVLRDYLNGDLEGDDPDFNFTFDHPTANLNGLDNKLS